MNNNINNKGFTLIELLAVMIVLLAISTFTISSISSAIERNKESSNNAKIKVILSYAKIYYEDHINNNNELKCIVLDDLNNEFNLSDDELTDAYGDKFNGVIKYDEFGIPTFYNSYSNCN